MAERHLKGQKKKIVASVILGVEMDLSLMQTRNKRKTRLGEIRNQQNGLLLDQLDKKILSLIKDGENLLLRKRIPIQHGVPTK